MNDPKILIVEDDAITALGLRRMLENLKYDVVAIARSGSETLELSDKMRPDIVLMDIVLEGSIDGIETAGRIRKSFDIPVVYITSSTDQQTLERAKKTEPYGYIIKPVSMNELYSTIETVLYRHRLGQKLKHSESLYRTLVETISHGIVEYNREGIVTFCNESFCAMTGYGKNEIIGREFGSFITNEGLTFDLTAEKASGQKYTRYYDVIKNIGGRLIDVQIDWDFKYDEDGGFTGVIAVITDITDRRQSEILRQVEHESAMVLGTAPGLREALDRLVPVLGGIPDISAACIYMTDEKNEDLLLASFAGPDQECIGESARIAPGTDEYDLLIGGASHIGAGILPGVLGRLQARLNAAGATIIPIRKEEDPAIFLLSFSNKESPLSQAVMNTIEMIAAHAGSVINRILAEAALHASEAKYRQLVETMMDGIFIFSPDNIITYANTRLCHILGYPIEEIIGRAATDFLDESNGKVFLIAAKPGAPDRVKSIDIEWITKNGSTVQSILSLQSIGYGTNESEERFAVVTDITDHKKIEQELMKIQKFESLSLLAGGIAHDYNNILTGILGNINLAKLNIDRESDIFEILDEAERASLKARDISQQLLTFSKGGEPIKKPLDIRALLYSASSFTLRGSNVKPEFYIADNLWIAEADEGQLNQVIDNILINAIQAMPEGGTIQVLAENVHVTEGSGLPLGDGRYVKISVRDQGTGIPEEYSNKIFDLFFTTKKTGNGIGLATSFSIIKKHSGHLSFDTKLGEGTTFHVYLPASDKIPLEEKTIALGEIPEHGKILVMDDEEIIRKIVKRMLTKTGFTVDQASDGAEAIDMYERAAGNGDPYSIVLMDLTVPGGMGGKEAAEKILEINPSAIIIASSGYANDPIGTNFREFGFSYFLPKPFEMNELVSAINETMKK